MTEQKQKYEEIECDICGKKLTGEQLAWEERISLSPCNCLEFEQMNKDIKNAKRKGEREQIKNEIKFLESPIKSNENWVKKRIKELKQKRHNLK